MEGENIQALRAQERKHISIVLTHEEVRKVFSNLNGIYQLIVTLMYGCGLRMNEVLNLRIKDIDFSFDKIYIRDSKSLKDRTLPLPLKLKNRLIVQVEQVCLLHEKDLAEGFGSVYMPFALEKKYPSAHKDIKWQFLFPMRHISTDPRSKVQRRHHIHPTTLGRNIKQAGKSQNYTNVSRHIFSVTLTRHIFYKMGLIYVLFRSCWGIKALKPR